MPAPSLLPILNAVGLALAIVGITITPIVIVVGPRAVPRHDRDLDPRRRRARSTSSRSSTTTDARRARAPLRRCFTAAAAGAARELGAVVRPAAHDVAHGQDARDLAAVDHDQVAEAAADHRGGGLLERPVRRREHEVGGEVLGDALRVGVLAAGDRRGARRAR